jgi:hypothetical protein
MHLIGYEPSIGILYIIYMTDYMTLYSPIFTISGQDEAPNGFR